MPEISVIILNWNGKDFLDDCLVAMRRQTFRDFETILVDNGSSDGSVEYIRKHFPEVNLLALPENLGFTGGNIAGYAQARGELIVLLNNDTEAHPRWLEEIHQIGSQFVSIARKSGFYGRKYSRICTSPGRTDRSSEQRH